MADAWPQEQVGTKIHGGQSAPPACGWRAVSISPHSADSRESIHALHQLIDQGTTIAQRIQKAADEARHEQGRIVQTVAPLQERLQLGAQMLTAFQSQITRIEIALAELKAQEKKAQVAEARAQQRLADVELRIESALERFAGRLEEMSQAALAKMAVAGTEADSGQQGNAIAPDLDRLSTTMHEIAERLAQMTQIRSGGAASKPSNRAEAGADEPANVHVDAPLRFQKWASGA